MARRAAPRARIRTTCGPKKMFDSLSSRIQNAFTALRGEVRLTESQVEDVLREIRLALLEADVNFNVVKAFIDRVRDRAMDQAVLRSLSPAQQVVKIVRDELLALFAGTEGGLTKDAPKPRVVLLLGLQGAGKTTTSGKLGRWLKRQGRNPVMVSTDVRRPAAIQQLEIVGDQAGVKVYAPDTMDPVARAKRCARRSQGQRPRHRDRGHRRPAAHRRRPDGGAAGDQGRRAAVGPPVRRRRHDRAGRDQERRRVQPPRRRHRRRAHEARWRRARRRRAVGGVGRGRADCLHRRRRRHRRPRAVPSRPHRLAHARHGRRPVAHREGRAGHRPGRGRRRSRRSSARTSSPSTTSASSSRPSSAWARSRACSG